MFPYGTEHCVPLKKNSLFHARPKDPKEALLLKVSSFEPHFEALNIRPEGLASHASLK